MIAACWISLVDSRNRAAVAMLICLMTTGCAAPLVECAREGDRSCVMRHLRAGVHPDRTGGGTTALMYASDSGDTNMIKLLLDYGASTNLRNEDDAGMTALMYAAWGCHSRAGALLLENGADCNLRRVGYYAADSTRVCTTALGDNALTLALREECLPLVEVLLEAGADPNVLVVRDDVTLERGWPIEWRRRLASDAQLAAAVFCQHDPRHDAMPTPLATALQVAKGNDELTDALMRFGASSTPRVSIGAGSEGRVPSN